MRDNRHDPRRHPFPGEPRGHEDRSDLNGSSIHGVPGRADLTAHQTEPVDLVAVQADDELINALSSGMSVSAPGVGGYDVDDRVAAILAAWKAEVDAEPIPELVDLDTAVSAVMAARPRSHRARHLAPLAAAAAFIVLAVGGVSVGSYSAQPDDALWSVSKVLFSERAESVEAAARVEVAIAKAKQALVEGQPAVAAQELKQAQADLVAVRPEEGLIELADVQGFLLVKAQETPPGTPADLTAPLATQPTRPVPPGVVAGPTQPLLPPSSSEPAVQVAPVSPVDPTAGPDPRRRPTQAEDPATPGGGVKPLVPSKPGPDVRRELSTVPTPGPTTQSSVDPVEPVEPTTVPGTTHGQGPEGPEGSGGATGPAGATAAGSGEPVTSPPS